MQSADSCEHIGTLKNPSQGVQHVVGLFCPHSALSAAKLMEVWVLFSAATRPGPLRDGAKAYPRLLCDQSVLGQSLTGMLLRGQNGERQNNAVTQVVSPVEAKWSVNV